MIYLYVITLVLPLAMSFFDYTEENEEFFSLFSLNKLLFFLNGMFLATLCGFGTFVGVVIGTVQVLMYYTAFKIMRNLEYNSRVKSLNIGDKGRCYNTITPQFPNKVLIAGEVYEASAKAVIPSFAHIQVVSINPLMVEETFKGDK